MRQKTKKLFLSSVARVFKKWKRRGLVGARAFFHVSKKTFSARKAFSSGLTLGVLVGVVAIGLGVLVISDSSPTSAELINTEFGSTFGLGTSNLVDVVIRIVQWALGLLGLVAVGFMIYGGFVWMTAAGNMDRVTKAKQIITRAAIGLVIVLLAWAIVLFVNRFIDRVTSPNPYPDHCYNGLCDAGEDCFARGGTPPVDCGLECGPCSGVGGESQFRITEFQDSNGSGDPRQDVYLCSKVKSLYTRSVSSATVEAAVTANTIKVVRDPAGTPADVAGSWTTRSKSVTYDPSALLDPNMEYQVQIPKSLRSAGLPSLQLLGCNALGVPGCDDVSDPITWNFTTGNDLDSVAPSITSTYPTMGGVGYPDRNVSRAPVVDVRFSEPIDTVSISDVDGHPVAGHFVLERLDGQGGAVQGAAYTNTDLTVEDTSLGFRVHLNPAVPLESFSWYRITVTGVEDLCSNVMSPVPVVWEFQTNDKAPGISSWYPQGANQCTDSHVYVTFNTSMYYNNVTFAIDDGPGGIAPITLSMRPENFVYPSYEMFGAGGSLKVNDIIDPGTTPVDNKFRVFEFVPNPTLPLDSTFTVTVTTDMIIDVNNNTLQHSWNFSTSDPASCSCTPYVTTIQPDQGLNGQCVTIRGTCFQGTSSHTAQIPNNGLVFRLGGTDHQATVGGYSNTQITTTVPNVFSVDDRPLPQVTITYDEAAYGSQSSTNTGTDFFINGTGQASGPCLYSIAPTVGIRNTGVTLRGTRFGSAASQSTQRVEFQGGGNTVADSSWNDTTIRSTVPATATIMNDNQVYIQNDAGASNPVSFDVIPPRPQINGFSPAVCDEACINAATWVTFSMPMVETTVEDRNNVKIFSCTDSTCDTLGAELDPGAGFPSYNALADPTMLDLGSPAYQAATSYRVIVRGGPNGVIGTDGGVLVGTNYTYESDPAFSWKFTIRNSNAECTIETVEVLPPDRSTVVSVNTGYVAHARGLPDVCDASGQVLHPSGFTWTWSSDKPVRAVVSSSNLNTATVNAAQETITDPPGYATISSRAVQISAPAENATGAGRLTIRDCETDRHCQNNCSFAGNGSECNVSTKVCTPWVESVGPTGGPKNSFMTVLGCYFGNTRGVLDLIDGGGLRYGADTNVCASGWRNTSIIAGVPDAPIGSYDLQVITAAGERSNIDRTFGITDLCQADGICVGGGNAGESCTDGVQCSGGTCGGFVAVPASGVPGICSIAPTAGRPGNGVRITGKSLGATSNAVEFTSTPVDIQTSTLIGSGTWNSSQIDSIQVPNGSRTGPLRVVADSCPSNPSVSFGISCTNTSQCLSGECCRQGVCVEASLCSTGGPGSLCAIVDNPATAQTPENPNCATGPGVPPGTVGDYDCMSDTGDTSSLIPPPPETATQLFGSDCRFCCTPGDISSTGLTCVANQATCSGGERGLYCGCTNDLQCDPGSTGTVACASAAYDSSRCCHPRPQMQNPVPVSGSTLSCTNGYIGASFTQNILQSSVSTTTITLLRNGVAVPARVNFVAPNGFAVSPSTPLVPNSTYTVQVRGGSTGVLNQWGIGMLADANWTFSVAGGATLCKVSSIRVEMKSDDTANPPEARSDDMFRCEGNPTDTSVARATGGFFSCFGDQEISSSNGNQHYFQGMPLDRNGVLLDPAGFTWSYGESGPDIVDVGAIGGGGDNQRYATNKLGDGAEAVTLTADGGATLGKSNAAARFRTFVCKNPWPAATAAEPFPFTDQAAAPHQVWGPAGSLATNFSLYYCRDRGDPNSTADDLPGINQGATNVKYDGTFRTVPSNTNDLIKQFLFFVDDGSSDAIGIRIYENYGYDQADNHGLSPVDWYYTQAGKAAPAPSLLNVDGYAAVHEGRTTYVAATNYDTSISGLVYNNDLVHLVYLMSYPQNGSDDTLEVFSQLRANWSFNTNIPNEKADIQEDIKRIQDLETIETALLDYKADNSTFPLLQGGTYLSGMSTSRWPSWTETLGPAVGATLPQDPVNAFSGCPDGYDAGPCWREEDKRYVCQDDSHVYQYEVDPNGQQARLYANLRDPLNQWATNPPNTLFDCNPLNGSDCTCANYVNLGSGSTIDRTPPQLTPLINGFPPPFPTVSGTIIDSGAIDAPAGVKEVEFFLDGIRQFTDTDGSDGWRWNMNSSQYADGPHTLGITALDNIGNRTTPRAEWPVILDNACPGCLAPDIFISTPVDGVSEGGNVEFKTITTDNADVAQVVLEIRKGTAIFTNTCLAGGASDKSVICDWPGAGWNSTSAENGDYIFAAVATDSDGRVTRRELNVNVDNTDNQNPGVSITEPADNADVIYSTTVRATATDNVGVARVEFYINGAFKFSDTVGDDDGTGNLTRYEWQWDTTKSPNSPPSVAVTAIAYDAVGRTSSATIHVNIRNPNLPAGACAPTECPSGQASAACPNGCCPQGICLAFGTADMVCRNGQWTDSHGDGICQNNATSGQCQETTTFPSDCSGQPVCGNNIIDSGELCDGSALPAGVSCASQGFYCGQLTCASDCQSLGTASCVAGSCGDGNVQNVPGCSEQCEGGNVASCPPSSFGTCSSTASCSAGTCSCQYTLNCSGGAGTCQQFSPDHCAYCQSSICSMTKAAYDAVPGAKCGDFCSMCPGASGCTTPTCSGDIRCGGSQGNQRTTTAPASATTACVYSNDSQQATPAISAGGNYTWKGVCDALQPCFQAANDVQCADTSPPHRVNCESGNGAVFQCTPACQTAATNNGWTAYYNTRCGNECTGQPDGTACSTDNNECTNDTCQSNACVHQAVPANTACTSDNNACTTDMCQGTVCQHSGVAQGTSCGSNQVCCGSPVTCVAGTTCGECVGRPDGYTCTDDSNQCTSDICVSQICRHNPRGGACNDGNACTTADTCVSGVCTPGGNVPAGNACPGTPGSVCCGTVPRVCTPGTVCPTSCVGQADNTDCDGAGGSNICCTEVCRAPGCTTGSCGAGQTCISPGTCNSFCQAQTCSGTTTDGACPAGCNRCTDLDCGLNTCAGCCSGAQGSSSCITSTSEAQCGANSSVCANCSDNNPCTTDSCAGASCSTSHPAVPDGTACTVGSLNGVCLSGICRVKYQTIELTWTSNVDLDLNVFRDNGTTADRRYYWGNAGTIIEGMVHGGNGTATTHREIIDVYTVPQVPFQIYVQSYSTFPTAAGIPVDARVRITNIPSGAVTTFQPTGVCTNNPQYPVWQVSEMGFVSNNAFTLATGNRMLRPTEFPVTGVALPSVPYAAPDNYCCADGNQCQSGFCNSSNVCAQVPCAGNGTCEVTTPGSATCDDIDNYSAANTDCNPEFVACQQFCSANYCDSVGNCTGFLVQPGYISDSSCFRPTLAGGTATPQCVGGSGACGQYRPNFGPNPQTGRCCSQVQGSSNLVFPGGYVCVCARNQPVGPPTDPSPQCMISSCLGPDLMTCQ
ncbi:MAG: Ig-like domain-containing protein [Patescibacteria group bacterium]|jgi:hypothetical protein